MANRLRALPVLVLLAAAVDTVAVRWNFAHRPASAGVFLQACGLWLAIGVIALIPATVGSALARRRRGPSRSRHTGLNDALGLLAWMVLPPIVHACLDSYTDIGGDLSGLLSARPWMQVALGLLAFLAAVALARLLAARVSTQALALGCAGLSLALGLGVSFHKTPRVVASSDRGDRPNLLLVVWDTTRAKSLEFLGYDRRTTPHLARLAEESVVFTNARSASGYTLTSHLSMLTGVYPSHHGARLRRQEFHPRRTPSVVEALRQAGYRTGGFVGTGVLRAQTGIGFGFEVWDDQVDPPVCDTRAWALIHDLQSMAAKLGPPFSRNGQPHWIQDFTRPASEVLERAAAWIAADDGRPWFCMINLYDVHWPYLPGDEARGRWVGDYGGSVDGHLFRSDSYVEGTELEERDEQHLRELYDAEMWQLDRDVDAFLSQLDIGKDTALVMTSDHGEAFGEGGRYEHSDILEAQVRVPALVRAPGRSSEIRGDPVSGVDVAPTLLALAGLPALEHHSGINLLAAPPETEQRLVLVEDRDHMRTTDVRIALYRGPWKLLRRGIGKAGRVFLYDLTSDPDGLIDVAADHPDLALELERELDGFRARWQADDLRDARTGGDGNLDALRGLGYTGE
jgi:arylsulfatase A-like enzyme